MDTKDIIFISDGEPVVGTWALSQGLKTDHRHLKRLVEKYKTEFVELGGIVAFRRQQLGARKRGHPVEEFILKEPQATYLITLLQNNAPVRQFKKWLSQEFFNQRKKIIKMAAIQAAHAQNNEWKKLRENGKQQRRACTDAVKAFICYAKEQGSKNADKYYMLLTKKENATLFSVELLKMVGDYNTRELLTHVALGHLKSADEIIEKALEDGMKEKRPYKDIYQLASKRLENFVELIGILNVDKGLLGMCDTKLIQN